MGPKKQARGFDEGSCRSNDLRCETAPSGSVSDALAVSVLAQFRSHGAFEAGAQFCQPGGTLCGKFLPQRIIPAGKCAMHP